VRRIRRRLEKDHFSRQPDEQLPAESQQRHRAAHVVSGLVHRTGAPRRNSAPNHAA